MLNGLPSIRILLFTLEAVIEGNEKTDYHYSMEASTKSDVELVSESLAK
ncbi:hypothetical protein [Parageobacillus thermoglucosidasius]|nr:hypothetical protein [Parageobacillus thermoglucosidasius]